MSRAIRAVAAIAVIASSFAIFASPAYAHERRTVGPYQLVVGFLTEPAFAGTANAAHGVFAIGVAKPAKLHQ